MKLLIILLVILSGCDNYHGVRVKDIWHLYVPKQYRFGYDSLRIYDDGQMSFFHTRNDTIHRADHTSTVDLSDSYIEVPIDSMTAIKSYYRRDHKPELVIVRGMYWSSDTVDFEVSNKRITIRTKPKVPCEP